MGIFSRLFGSKKVTVDKREGEVDVYNIPNENERMNWGIEKAKLTLHYFEKSLRSPRPEQQYFAVKVKIDDGVNVEHIWLNEPHFDTEGNLFGSVGNKPMHVTLLSLNQKIGIQRDLISDWMIIENGKLIGGYTIRAIRDGLVGKELEDFDQSVGLYIDEGVDYFEHNFDTPEGAILCLEDAYDEKNLEKAVLCKDFEAEARLMLQKINKTYADNQEIISSTADALKLSFMNSLQGNMPSFANIKRAFPLREKVNDKLYLIKEVCWYPDGSKSAQKLYVHNAGKGWRVLNPYS